MPGSPAVPLVPGGPTGPITCQQLLYVNCTKQGLLTWLISPGGPRSPGAPGGPGSPAPPLSPFPPLDPLIPGCPGFPRGPSGPGGPRPPFRPSGPRGPRRPGAPCGPWRPCRHMFILSCMYEHTGSRESPKVHLHYARVRSSGASVFVHCKSKETKRLYYLKIKRRRNDGKVDDTYTFASLAVNSRPARQPYLPPPTLNTPCTTHKTQAAAVTRGKQASHSKHPEYSRCPPAPPGIPVCPVRLVVRSSLAVLAPRLSRGGRADPPSHSCRASPGDRSPRTAAAGASIGATIRRLCQPQ